MFEDCCSGIMEPYGGNMPLFNSPTTNDATVTIVSESYDDGMKVTRIQTPPRTETKTLIEAIDNVLGMVGCLDISTKSDEKSSEKKDGKLRSDKKQEHNFETEVQDKPGQKPFGEGDVQSESEPKDKRGQ